MATPVQRTRATREQFVQFALSRDEHLRNTLVEAHLGLAHQLARRFVSRGESYDDLVQVASLALVKSVDRYDPERGVEFSTFATRTVIGELKRHFRDKGWAIRAPRRLQEVYLELGPAVESLTQQLSRPPSVFEMAESVGASEETVLEALEAGRGYRAASIDAPARNEGTIADQLGDVDSGFTAVEDHLQLALSVADLSDRERVILRLRFEEGMTQSEIAGQIGISQMHVSRLLAAALGKLREAFTLES